MIIKGLENFSFFHQNFHVFFPLSSFIHSICSNPPSRPFDDKKYDFLIFYSRRWCESAQLKYKDDILKSEFIINVYFHSYSTAANDWRMNEWKNNHNSINVDTS